MPKFTGNCRKNGQRDMAPPLSVSQNFLTGRGTIFRLLRNTNLNKTDHVLEIGAGKGHITSALSASCGRVTAYELDKNLYTRLAEKKAEGTLQNVRLIGGDFLQASLPQGVYKVFANIPFSCTSEILRKLTEAKNPPTHSWLVVEKGAAKRFCGIPCENKTSLLLKPFFTADILCELRKTDFHPVPRVDTVLLRLVQKEEPDLVPALRESYRRFLEHGLQKGVVGRNALLTKRQVATALRLAKLPQISPSGLVSYVQWLCLYRCWLRFCGTLKL